MAQTNSTPTGRAQQRPIVHGDLGVVRWGPVWGGAMVATAVFALFATFWIAVSYGTDNTYFRSNLAWWIGLAAIAAYFLGGALAGVLSVRSGPGTGAANSAAVWAVGTIGALIVPIPLELRVPGSATLSGGLTSLTGQTLWITFATMAIGLGACVLGGMSATGWQLSDPMVGRRTVAPPAPRKETADSYS